MKLRAKKDASNRKVVGTVTVSQISQRSIYRGLPEIAATSIFFFIIKLPATSQSYVKKEYQKWTMLNESFLRFYFNKDWSKLTAKPETLCKRCMSENGNMSGGENLKKSALCME